MLTGNWIEKNNIRIAVPAEIALQTNSPLDDKTYVFYAGNKQSSRGDNTYPFTIRLSQQALVALGMPHIIQKISTGYRQTGWTLYSDGTLVDTFTLLFTSIERDLNGNDIICEVMLFNAVSDFVNAINNKNVNDLQMDGVRVIEDLVDAVTPFNYYTAPIYPGATPPAIVPDKAWGGVISNFTISPPSNSGSPSNAEFSLICIQATSSNPADLCGTSTADYAAIVTLNGDPGADKNGDYICFPPVFVTDDQNADSWINFWDPTGGHYYPCVGSIPDQSSSVTIYAQNIYQDYGNHIVPMYYYHQVLRHCFSEFGYTLKDESGILNDEHFKRMVLVNNFDILNALTVTFTNLDGSSKTRTVGYWQLPTLINPKNHLPADSIQAFLNDCMVKFNCYFEFQGQTVYIRFSDFKTVARELKNFNPKYKESNTLDSGVTIAYDFPADKQYDNIAKIKDITPSLSTEKVFFAGINKAYPVALGDTIPNPLPPDDYYAVLYEDCNQMALILEDTPAWSSGALFPTFFYPYDYFIDNVIPITLGVETRPDSPSVNKQTIDQSSTQSYNLKYPPISHINNIGNNWAKQTPYSLPGMEIKVRSTDYVVPSGSYLGGGPQYWTSSANINMNVGGGQVIIPGQKILITPVFDATLYTGYFYAQGVVVSYNNDTGWLNFDVTYMMPDWYTIDPLTPPGSWTDYATNPLYPSDYYFEASGLATSWWSWACWDLTISPYEITPQVSYSDHNTPNVNPNPNGIPDASTSSKIIVNPDGGNIPMISAPVMQAAISAYPTQDYLLIPKMAYGYTGGTYNHTWGIQPMIAGSGGWVADIPSGVAMPGGWVTRSGSTIIEMGFYWGIQNPYTRVFDSYTTDINTSLLSASHTDSLALFIGVGSTILEPLAMPILTGYERVYGNSSVDPGWFNLGLHGPRSLPKVFWDGFINQFIYNRKFEITVYEPLRTSRNHAFHQSVLWRGIRLYVSQQSVALPQKGQGVKYLAYQI